jgi:hypothetical protein
MLYVNVNTQRKESKMKKYICYLAAVFILTGCAHSLEVDMFTEDEVPTGVERLIMMNYNAHNRHIIRSLHKQGFIVKAQPTTKQITEKTVSKDVTYHFAEARYGIRHDGFYELGGTCYTSGRAKLFGIYDFELVDLDTNETILIVSMGGWTRPCPGVLTPHTEDLFGDMAKELASIIK